MGFEMDKLPADVLATSRRGKVRERRVDATRLVEALDDLGAVVASRPYTAAEDAARVARESRAVESDSDATIRARLLGAIKANRTALAAGGLTTFQEAVLRQLIGIERLLLRQLGGTD